VIVEPPVAAGATHATDTTQFPATAVTAVGASKAGCGVDGVDTAAGPVPAEFFAVTLNMYVVPLVRPVKVQVRVEVVQVFDPGDETTVYEVIADPPLLGGADHRTVADVDPATATAPTGASGTALGVTAAEVDDCPVPTKFVAVTAKVYAVPLLSPVMTQLSDPVVEQLRPPGAAVAV